MRSLRLRLAAWFGISFLAVIAAFIFFSHRLLEQELREKSWRKDYPEHPDWKLHGSFSEAEVSDITGELTRTILIGALPLVAGSAALGFWLARKSLRPIASVNEQLQTKTTANLDQPIHLPEMDVEFRDLLRHLNDLLARLNNSFGEINNYAAKVAHEFRTPLSILRLKLEQAEGQIRPELAEELQSELHRLQHVVDQSLLIGQADRGCIVPRSAVFDLVGVVTDMVQDFRLLAAEESRQLILDAPGECCVRTDKSNLRQIIHNLLTNALKHGSGHLHVRVRRHARIASLVIANRITGRESAIQGTLGLGLRVVEALVRLDPEMRVHRRKGQAYYVVRLVIPAQPAPAGISETPAAAGIIPAEDKNFFT